jgi:hypothetical protein
VEDVVKRLGLLALLLLGSSSFAQAESTSIDGWGRVTLMGGYRWVPNWYFAQKASAAGMPYTDHPGGGPQGIASFGYGATDWLEVSVDVFGAYERFSLAGFEPFTSFVYGGLVGARLMKTNLLFPGFTPYVGVQLGPVLSDINASTATVPERLMGGYMAVGGFHWRFTERWALTFDARWLYARNVFPGISGLNVGGVLFSVGVSMFFPPAPKRDLDVPGFGGESHLPN